MNLPNKLTVLRMFLIPLFLIFMIFPFTFPYGELVSRVLAAAVFVGTAITDYWDGHLARKYGLITDFGKFLDPLADKMMVLGAMLGLLVLFAPDTSLSGSIFLKFLAISSFLVLFRELAVTSLRLAASGSGGVVIAANKLGKVKTVTQIVFVMVALLEPVVFGWFFRWLWAPLGYVSDWHILSYASMLVMAVMTVWSGFAYFKAYFPLINSNK
ncbi:MAG: CDP-diacylglycerol--glycerol-3-phosphate 3-phosphatidyltransferase [Clostridia bacterium]|nr:CDP-diacylglycerol--glycerol-3-phosphate 3-phosphatidyltransferase [Clostridia bacterium]